MPPRSNILWLILAGAVGLYLYSRTQSGQGALGAVSNYLGDLLVPRGERDNNPGNIVRSSIAWRGELSQADVAAAGHTWDPTFVQFDTPQNGIRAIGHVLVAKSLRGLTNVDAIIRDYSATDQDAYVANVAQALGVDPFQTIDVQARLPNLAAAIIQQENGEQPYDPANIAVWVYS